MRPTADQPSPAEDEESAAPDTAAPDPNTQSGSGKASGSAGTKGKATSDDSDVPHTRIELHRPSSELQMPRGSILGCGARGFRRIGRVVVKVWSEEEATCDAV